MDFIKEWAGGLVVMSIIASAVYLLSPEGKIEKQVKTAVSIVLLFVMIKPFFDIDLSSAKTDYNVTGGIEDYISSPDNSGIKAHFSDVLNEKIADTLSAAGYKSFDIISDVELNEEKELTVKRVTVYVDEEEMLNRDEILKIIKNEYGIIAQVEVSD